MMNAKKIVFFLGIAWSLNGAGLGSVPITALLVEFDKVKEQIEQADVEQELKDEALELWIFAQTVSLSPHSIPIKMKQLNILKCILLEFPPDERQEPIETVDGIAALLAEGSTAPDKPVKRNLPEVDPPPDACKVEIVRLNTDQDEFESIGRIYGPGTYGIISLDGLFQHVFLSARASEPPGSFEWFDIRWVLTGGEEEIPGLPPVERKSFPLSTDPSSASGEVYGIETGNGILEIKLTPETISDLEGEEGGGISARILVLFTSADGLRKCNDSVEIFWF